MDKITFLYFSIVFIILGLVLIIFKNTIGKINDKMDLTDKEKMHYKNTIIPLVGIIFIIASASFFVLFLINEENKNQLINFINNYKNLFYLFSGIIILIYGIFTIIIRILKKESKFFIKYEPMKRKFGVVLGNIIHIVGYTIIPILIGFYFISKNFR